jgi:hypothetical protein
MCVYVYIYIYINVWNCIIDLKFNPYACIIYIYENIEV